MLMIMKCFNGLTIKSSKKVEVVGINITSILTILYIYVFIHIKERRKRKKNKFYIFKL